MFTISYWFAGTNHEADATFERESQARKAARAIAADSRYTDVTVWRGGTGAASVAVENATCDAARFGDSCPVCSPAA